jgi:hypothetical protein
LFIEIVIVIPLPLDWVGIIIHIGVGMIPFGAGIGGVGMIHFGAGEIK